MRIIANENVMGTAIAELRARGHEVLAAKESMRSAPDESILSRARAEGRILITFDKDFGELAFEWGLPPECGVILFGETALAGHLRAATADGGEHVKGAARRRVADRHNEDHRVGADSANP
jgi:predicted nuclease of predicted toxin-antitoxin system